MSSDLRSNPFVITLDGPAGVGKSTMARRLAATLGAAYLDTGAMYRTLGLRLGAAAADMNDEELRRRCAEYRFSLEPCPTDPDALCLFCNGRIVGDEIRTEKAGRLASLVARLPALREALHSVQRDMGRRWSLVAEGRDMGTRVFPEAKYKFFLDARPEVRAERRCRDLAQRGEAADKEAVLAAIVERDKQDRERAVDPLRPAPDARVIDSSDLTPDEVLQCLVDAVRAPAFSHLAADGSLRMADVESTAESERVARARAVVEMRVETLDLLRRRAMPKGDVLTTAKIAGIMAAKRAWEMIPLRHPLSITYADLRFSLQDDPPAVILESEVRAAGRTGVDMEALFAVQTAAATIYDMVNAVQKDIIIRDVRLVYKADEKSGDFATPA